MCHLCLQSAADFWERQEATLPGVVPVNTGKTVWNTSQVIDQLESPYKVNGNVIEFSFPSSGNFFPLGEAAGHSELNSFQQSQSRLIYSLWDDLIAPRFEETSNANTADLTISNTTTNISYAHAWYPSGGSVSGDAWLNTNSGSLQNPETGAYGFMTIMHEIGHTLGLEHAGNYNGGSPTYAANASHAQDTHMYTIMSYFNARETGADWVGADGRYHYAQTPMLHDVLAIQAIYGADMTTRTNDTVYGFNSNTNSPIFDFSQNDDPILTIWDAGGKDTLDLSGYSSRSVINLAPGSFSDAASMTNNISIAYGAWIENAVGGTGNDSITGNTLANRLEGGAGSDALRGDGGNDVLIGGTGGDALDGGAGWDIASYAGASQGIWARLWDGRGLSGDAAGDTFTAVEALDGTAYADTLSGDNGSNHLIGRGGNDGLWGGGGSDLLIGGLGADFLHGGAGWDLASYSGASQGVWVRLWDGKGLTGEATGDRLREIEALEGSSYSDTLSGNSGINSLVGGAGGDFLWAGAGNDIVNGGSGSDLVVGGQGNDQLYGDVGSDTFLFRAGDGTDTIFDYQDGVDKLRFSDGIDFSDLAISAQGSGTRIAYGVGDAVVVSNAAVSLFSSDDFQFV